jgi:hypothetical protein
MPIALATSPAAVPPVSDTVRLLRNAPFRQFLTFSSLILMWVAADVLLQFLIAIGPSLSSMVATPETNWCRLATAYLQPAFSLVLLILLNRFARQGKVTPPRLLTACGLALIVGGAMFDIAVTVIHSPGLENEANPYVRALLDSGHSLEVVYAHGVVTQGLYVALFCAVWIGFLRHQGILLETIRLAAPAGWLDFVKAVTGGGHLTMRQWLLPLRASEVPLAYHGLWLTGVAVVFGITLFRYYAALEWLGYFEPAIVARVVVVLGGVSLAIVGYVVGLAFAYRRVNRDAT